LEKFGSSSKNLKTQLPYEQAILLPGIQNWDTHTHKKACAKMFIVALSKIAKSGNKPTAHRIVNG
jgi:hypothetical protein